MPILIETISFFIEKNMNQPLNPQLYKVEEVRDRIKFSHIY